jgi:hypothetical protein
MTFGHRCWIPAVLSQIPTKLAGIWPEWLDPSHLDEILPEDPARTAKMARIRPSLTDLAITVKFLPIMAEFLPKRLNSRQLADIQQFCPNLVDFWPTGRVLAQMARF